MIKNINYLIIFVLLLMFSCSASYKPCKQGQEFELLGKYEEAANYYYRSFIEDNSNSLALVGLKNNASKVQEKMMINFLEFYNNQKYDYAIDEYNKILDYDKKMANVGIVLNSNNENYNKYLNCKNIAAEEYYKKGKQAFELGRWSSAISYFEKIDGYKRNYKDTDKLLQESKINKNNSFAENEYNKAVRSYNYGDYKSAYYSFEKCLKYNSRYKDAQRLKESSLEKGKVRIGIFPFTNDTRIYDIHNKLYSYVLSNAVNYKSPFIDVVDRNNLTRLLREQSLGMSGIIDESSAAEAGKILGLNVVVIGKIVDATQTGGDIKSTPCEAFETYQVRKNDKIVTKSKKATFYVHEGESEIIYKAQYQIINTETSKILKSDIITSSASDYVKFCTYTGNYENLTLWDPKATGNFGVLGSAFIGDIDQKLFKARKNLKKPEDMAGDILEELAKKMSNTICKNLDI